MRHGWNHSPAHKDTIKYMDLVLLKILQGYIWTPF